MKAQLLLLLLLLYTIEAHHTFGSERRASHQITTERQAVKVIQISANTDSSDLHAIFILTEIAGNMIINSIRDSVIS
jgi:hypothetical protein